MLTIEDLDAFLDELGDLTRDADPLMLAVEATELLKSNLAQQFMMQRRAAAALDAHYLHGHPLATIAKACGMSTQAVRLWLQDHGPKHYLTVGEERDNTTHGESRVTLRLVRVERDDMLMKRMLRQQVLAGRRIVPAGRNLVDPSQPDGWASGIDASTLWDELRAS